MLRVEQLQKSFGTRRAVDGIAFDVKAGETYGLLGPNGAGKTTTISMIAGLLPSDGGTISVDGITVVGESLATKRITGYVPQAIALYVDLSATENLMFFGRLHGLRSKELTSRVEQSLEAVGLTDRASDRVSTYSGGMQRRLNIAAGLLNNPKLLILDEPTVGVDPQSRASILEYVSGLRSRGTAILYTTHYMEEAERICDRVGIIDEGRLLTQGTPKDLMDGSSSLEDIFLSLTGRGLRD